jgi:acyl carrier protein
MSDIRAAVRAFILKRLPYGEEPGGLRDDTALLGTGLLDSFNTLELVQFIERTYQIEVTASEIDMENFDSIQRIEAFVKRKMG